MTDPLIHPTTTDRVVTTIVDHPIVRDFARRFASVVVFAAPTGNVRDLIDPELLEQAILGAITRFVESAIDGQV